MASRTRRFLPLAILALGPLATIVAPRADAQVAPAAAHAGPRHTAADVAFMQGMIGHHAQAVVMAAMAATHGAGSQVALFCRKIMVSQRDEIDQMQQWLRDRGERVPGDSASAHSGHAGHAGHAAAAADDHSMHMPGMLTAAQLAQLDAARGVEFDRLLLTLMIQHHEGALEMVATLFASPGAGQGPEIFGFASGVDADQRAEIARMRAMLANLPSR